MYALFLDSVFIGLIVWINRLKPIEKNILQKKRTNAAQSSFLENSSTWLLQTRFPPHTVCHTINMATIAHCLQLNAQPQRQKYLPKQPCYVLSWRPIFSCKFDKDNVYLNNLIRRTQRASAWASWKAEKTELARRKVGSSACPSPSWSAWIKRRELKFVQKSDLRANLVNQHGCELQKIKRIRK